MLIFIFLLVGVIFCLLFGQHPALARTPVSFFYWFLTEGLCKGVRCAKDT